MNCCVVSQLWLVTAGLLLCTHLGQKVHLAGIWVRQGNFNIKLQCYQYYKVGQEEPF